MCDDFFEDNFEDSFSDPGNDFEEDLADEVDGEWYEDSEALIDESTIENSSVTPDNQPDRFDLTDAIILGMIGGAFYDAAAEEKQQLKRLKSEDKNKK